ncbi:Hybrid signal transduction histidine kinase B [Lachnellula subtilissima]|uniref:histidine kinase n=1 Tax=Lachnellula subtilissima TaxID=602034 RepID=A0A8H8UBG4_9HELO|nr:Hybrid signal transduction histidine kinase B [Lachnellula subtilissima]
MASVGSCRAREVYRSACLPEEPDFTKCHKLMNNEHRYYQPKSVADAAGPSPSSNTDGLTTLQSFSDTALTAFAQLIAIRLSAQRAIVSLADHENEYFLAESTSSLSRLDDGPTQNAWMSISGAWVPLDASLAEQTLRLAPNLDSSAGMSPVLFIPDLRLDENMSRLECVERAPHLRFYCGVPLTNKKGVNIGCVYVVDDKPRSEFSLEQAQFLNTMAATIMDHLENIRAKEEVTRVTKMSQALHAFIEGNGTMEGDWQRLKRYDLPSGAGVAFHWESHNEGGKKPETVLSNHTRTPNQTSSDVFDSGPTTPGLSPLQHTTSTQDPRFNYNNSPWGSTTTPRVPEAQSDESQSGGITPTTNRGMDAEFSTDGFSNLLHRTFSRASNLVREGMEVDGAVFFDAPFRFYQGRSNLQPDTRRSDPHSTETSTESSDEISANIRPGPRPYARPSHQPAAEDESLGLPETAELEQVKSDILGYSTANSSSWNKKGSKDHPSFASINQSLLTALVKRYPTGELFVFDENGPTLPLHASTTRGSQENTHKTITSTTEEKQAQHDPQILELQSLLASFPGSRQIFFVPLYDSTSGCFIGSFAWSTSATRIFSVENHLGYLIAFGHSLMSEITKLNTLSADHAKGDFISNVSHELRSPLHGVLASVEFLADTTLDGFQRNLVQTVDICGRTLLDTIEHVLDFSKIKKFGQDSMQSMGILADLDVSAVIEEVLEGVFAGFEFNGLSSLGLADMTKSHSQGSLPTQRNTCREPPTIIIDMGFREQWNFPTVPGTWRRLTMNIFGNALKYTRSGYIRVKLEAQSIPSIEDGKKAKLPERTLVTLTVTDSGQGMSSDFMKTKLFMPFSQEDVTAPGTGLGLSIVKEIVDLAGGTIDVRSELGRGTEITLSLPLENCPASPSKTSAKTGDLKPGSLAEGIDEPITAVRRRGGGRTITIRGFEVIPGSSNLQIASLSGLKASIENYITDWFQLQIASGDAAVDILICDESALVHSSPTELRCQALLILCSNSARRDIYTSNLDASQIIEVIGKPCGPHRLAKALLKLL